MNTQHESQPEAPREPGSPADRLWDVVVVGAGPCGSSAARAASRNGAATLLLDSAEFPRYKTCGGGLIGISFSLIDDAGRLPIQDLITRVSVTLHGRMERRRAARDPILRMVSREDLDLHLVDQAVRDGAVFRSGTKVTRVEQDPAGEVRIHTAAGCIRARAVVGADGSSGRTARHVGVVYAITDVGLEYELEAGDRAAEWRGRVHLDWGEIPGSYGWVFPKRDTLTVGVIAERGKPEETRAYLARFVAGLGLEGLKVLRDSGHLTRCRAEGSPLSRGRVLVAGDAAGLLDPWTREGISYALRSGRLAGEHAARMRTATTPEDVAGVERDYAADIERDLGPEMRAGALTRNAFGNHPGFFHFLIGWTGRGWTYFCRISRGETTAATILTQRRARIPLGLLMSRGPTRPATPVSR